jgi:acid phosphatase (class A)
LNTSKNAGYPLDPCNPVAGVRGPDKPMRMQFVSDKIMRALAALKGVVIVALILAPACGSIAAPPGSSRAYVESKGPPPGYLAKGEYPDSVALLPPPPAPESVALALDEQLNRQALELRDTPRWQLAAQDAMTRFPDAAGMLSCALGAPINQQDTPSAYLILRRSVIDVGMSVREVKKHYQRTRPFVVNEQPVCTPTAIRYLKKDGSYPSGHTAAGWAWALIFAEIAPDKADAVLARGWEFGQSRAICNVHWQSDVTQGRVIGATLVARLHANDEFRADLANAREEIAAVRAQGLPPNRDCAAEAKALAKNLPADQQVSLN